MCDSGRAARPVAPATPTPLMAAMRGLPHGEPNPDLFTGKAASAEIRKELREYYVWLYQERPGVRDHELEDVLESRPMNVHDSNAIEGKITMEEL